MKLLLSIVPLLVLLAASFALQAPASAAPNAQVTLTVGQTEIVTRNGCALQVKKNTDALIVVKCNPITVTANAEAVAAHTLNPGQKLKIKADGCRLAVLKNKPGKVKVKCNPLPDETVTVGPGGAFSFSDPSISIQVGETVEWVWGSSNHTVTSGDGTPDNLFCSPDNQNCATAPSSNAGATYQFKFDQAGTFKYYCRVHGISMSGAVTVYEP